MQVRWKKKVINTFAAFTSCIIEYSPYFEQNKEKRKNSKQRRKLSTKLKNVIVIYFCEINNNFDNV